MIGQFVLTPPSRHEAGWTVSEIHNDASGFVEMRRVAVFEDQREAKQYIAYRTPQPGVPEINDGYVPVNGFAAVEGADDKPRKRRGRPPKVKHDG